MNTNTIDYLLEPFLTQFYLIDAIADGFISDSERRKIYRELAKVFCIEETELLDEYYAASELPQFKAIRDFGSYERMCRTMEFAEKTGQNPGLTATDRVILSQKREAMRRKIEMFEQGKNLTRELISTTLLHTATNGNLNSMLTLAYMEYHGICMYRDESHALRRLRLCAKWNSLFGCLMGIEYDNENAERYYGILNTTLVSTTQRRMFEHIRKARAFSGECGYDDVAKLIEKAFGLNIIKRNVYDRIFAKVAFSEIVSVEDKKKLLLNRQKDAIVSLTEIPFDITGGEKPVFNKSSIDNVPLKRDGEQRRIARNLAVASCCSAEVYKPLLIIGADEFVTQMYARAIASGFRDGTVVELDAQTLSTGDFKQTAENVFLRGLSETGIADTVFIVSHCDEIDRDSISGLQKMLDYGYRKKFRLTHPTVSLDLSEMLPVLFASCENTAVSELAEYCDVVDVAAISDAEKSSVIDSVFETRRKLFGGRTVSMNESGRDALHEYDSMRIREIIDSAIRTAIYENSGEIDQKTIEDACRELSFSGSRREFGFTGGTHRA